MNAPAGLPFRQIDAGTSVLRVRCVGDLIHIEATIKRAVASGSETIILPGITPGASLRLSDQLASAAIRTSQRTLTLDVGSASRHVLSSAAVAEMRRLRAGGVKLHVIAGRFHCSASAVSYQTAGLLPPAANNARRRPPEVLNAIVRMHAEGITVREIAAALDCSESGVRAVIRRGNAPPVGAPSVGPALQIPMLMRPSLVPRDRR